MGGLIPALDDGGLTGAWLSRGGSQAHMKGCSDAFTCPWDFIYCMLFGLSLLFPYENDSDGINLMAAVMMEWFPR